MNMTYDMLGGCEKEMMNITPWKVRGFEEVVESHKKHSNNVTLPTRGSATSAGYDFYLPHDVAIQPGETVVVWTDVKAYMQAGEVLQVYPRSSIGIKLGLQMANTVGIIDSDYYSNASNDGNIGIALTLPLKEVEPQLAFDFDIDGNIVGYDIGSLYNDPVILKAGERIAQGIFMPFLPADNGNTDAVRTGGIGSSGK